MSLNDFFLKSNNRRAKRLDQIKQSVIKKMLDAIVRTQENLTRQEHVAKLDNSIISLTTELIQKLNDVYKKI